MPPRPRESRPGWSLCSLLVYAGLAASLAGFPKSAPRKAAAAAPAPGACAATVQSTIQGVAHRIYAEVASGQAVSASRKRLDRSGALAAAVASGDARAADAAVRPLMRAQIKRIEITHAGRPLLAIGSAVALAPVNGVLRDAGGATVGAYTFSVAQAAGTAKLIHAVTGANVTITAGVHRITSTTPHTSAGSVAASFSGTRFPAGAARITLRTSSSPVARCGPTTTATVANTIGAIGKRVFRSEAQGARAHQVLRIVARDPGVVSAVAHDDAAALRARIVHFFQVPKYHVVRIRATDRAGRLVNDVGGPYVLAPAGTTIRSHGRAIGRVTLSIQDDAGYVKIMHRFTDAGVVLDTADGRVPGSSAAPTALLRSGTVTVAGRSEQVVSFDETRFPSGPLHISLLIPS